MPKENAKKTKSVLKNRPNQLLVVVCLLLVVTLGFIYLWPSNQSSVFLKGRKFTVDIARTDEARSKGLSGRSSLSGDRAMLFIFDQPGVQCFWMKDMNFSIDILWFDKDQKLIHQEQNVSPSTYPSNFCPEGDAKYVLELKAGVVDSLGLSGGDELELNNL